MKKALLVLSTFAAVPVAFAQDAAIQTAFDGASTSAQTVVGWIAVALVGVIAAGWILKAIRTGK